MRVTALLALTVFVGVGGCAKTSSPVAGATTTSSGRMGSHGMVAFGTPNEAFLSHIPMFGGPHDVQAIFAGSFKTLDGSALPDSFSDRPFTFLPDRMSLDALRSGALNELRGQIFLGNFEAGGQPLPAPVRFQASRVVHQHVLDAGAPSHELGYLFLGSLERAFAIHRIAGSPSFDEVLVVELESGGGGLTNAQLAAGVEARLAGVPDAATTRLGLAREPRSFAAGSGTFKVTPKGSLSCLIGPEFSAPCP